MSNFEHTHHGSVSIDDLVRLGTVGPGKGFSHRTRRNINSPLSDESFVNKSKALDLLTKSSSKDKTFFAKDLPGKNKLIRKLKKVHTKKVGRFFRKLLKFIKLLYNVQISAKELCNYIDRFELRIVHHGFKEACKQFRSLYNFGLRYCARSKSDPLERFSLKEGFPRILKPFKRIMDGELKSKASVLTILDLPKLYGEGDGRPDLKGIIESGVIPKAEHISSCASGSYFMRLKEHNVLPSDEAMTLAGAWEQVLEESFPSSKLKERQERLKHFAGLSISSKAGPNGPALISAPRDFLAVLGQLDFKGSSLLSSIKRLSDITENVDLTSTIKFFEGIIEEQVNLHSFPENSHLSGKLSIKQELFGKSRLIAIIDFFTQSCLKPLHEVQFEWLGHQPEDGTFNQDNVSSRIKQLSLEPVTPRRALFSLDLTEATNRLPIDLQYEIVSQQFGPEIAILWYILCSERPFRYEDNDVHYAVGQPMGTYSSWSNLATINHMIARTSMKVNNLRRIKSDPRYFVIGDDFVCVGLDFANTYTKILNSIGVKISETKGYTPFSSIDYDSSLVNPFSKVSNVAEIAKRVFMDGIELTPIRPLRIFESLFEPAKFKQLVNNLFERFGTEFNSDLLSEFSELTTRPKTSLHHVLSLYNPCLYTQDLLSQIHDNDSDVTSILGVLDSDYLPLADRSNQVVQIIKSYGNITFNDLYYRIFTIFNNKVVDRFKLSMNRLSKFLNERSFKDLDMRPFDERLPVEYGLGFRLMLDFLLLYCYKYSMRIFNDISTILKGDVDSFDRIRDVCTLLSSVRDLDLLLRGSRSSDSKSESVSRLVVELEPTMREIIQNPVVDQDPQIIKFEDVEELFILKEEQPANLNRFIPRNASQKAFLSTKEGFTSLLSPAVLAGMQKMMNDPKFLERNKDTIKKDQILSGSGLNPNRK